MKWLIDKVGQFNHWYDGLAEPRRFLTFIVPMAYAIFAMNLGPRFDIGFLTATGFAVFGFFAFIGMMRAFSKKGQHVLIAGAMLLGLAVVAAGLTI